MAALEGHQADDPLLRAAREESPHAGASGESRSGLHRVLDGREDLRLVGDFPQAAGAPRTPSLHLPGVLLGRVHPHVIEVLLKRHFE
jgi:hypothetical protein